MFHVPATERNNSKDGKKEKEKDELQRERAERNTDPLISSMCYSSAP